MAKYQQMIILSAVSLLLCSSLIQAFPKQSLDKSSSEESEENIANNLLIYVLSEFNQLGTDLLDDAEKLFKKVVEDIGTFKDQTPALQANAKNITDFLAKYDSYKSKEEGFEKVEALFNLVEEMSYVMNKYEDENLVKGTAEDKLVEKSFVKNGVDEMENNLKDKFGKIVTKVTEEVEKYLAANTKEIKMKDWLNKMKSEDDFEKKSEVFSGFFALFADDE